MYQRRLMSKTGIVLQVGYPEKQTLKKGIKEDLFIWEVIPESTNRGGEKMNQESLGNSIQHISASVYLRAKEAGKFTHRLPSVIGSGLFLGMLTPWDFWLPWRRLSTLLLPEKKAFRQSCDDCSKKPSTCKGIHTTFTDVKGIRGRH